MKTLRKDRLELPACYGIIALIVTIPIVLASLVPVNDVSSAVIIGSYAVFMISCVFMRDEIIESSDWIGGTLGMVWIMSKIFVLAYAINAWAAYCPQ